MKNKLLTLIIAIIMLSALTTIAKNEVFANKNNQNSCNEPSFNVDNYEDEELTVVEFNKEEESKKFGFCSDY